MDIVSFMRALAQRFQNLYYVSNKKLCLHQLIWTNLKSADWVRFFEPVNCRNTLYTDKLSNPWEKEIG